MQVLEPLDVKEITEREDNAVEDERNVEERVDKGEDEDCHGYSGTGSSLDLGV